MTSHTIKKGYDIPLAGAPDAVLSDAPEPLVVAVEPTDFPGIKPKLLVREGESVKTGQPLFYDKRTPDVHFVSPVTGVVKAIELGARRFPMRILFDPAPADDHWTEGARLDPNALRSASREEVLVAMQASGLWPLILRRPVGRMAKAAKVPSAIYVNGMDTEPLAADPAFATQGRKSDLQLGVDLMRKLTDGKVYLTLRAGGDYQSELRDLKGVEVHDFAGPHPSGLVGTHIQAIAPLHAGEVAWCLKAQDLALFGAWLRTGHYPTHRVVALSGSRAPKRQYFRVRQGASLVTLTDNKVLEGDLRVIDGTVLSGTAVDPAGYLGFYTRTVTVIPEGKGRRDLFGWGRPQFGKLSYHRSVLSWLTPRKSYDVDAQLNGGRRPIINVGAWESVTPLDIYPTFLVRAIQANDLEEAINLGLLEVTEEDVALCTFVDASKIEVGEVIRRGLDMFEAEEG